MYQTVQPDPQDIEARGLLGVYRSDSGWHEWANDPRYANLHWRMDEVFARGRQMAEADLLSKSR